MSKLAYFDLASGASGDMIIAAIIDAGRRQGIDAETPIRDAIASLGLECAIEFIDDERGGLACLRAEVKTGEARHTPEQLRDAIASADAPEAAKQRALQGLDALVRAESTVHGSEDVHLHELGSADTAADLLSASVGLAALDVSSVAAAPVPTPSGWISSDHGELPLPAPVTLELLKGAALRASDANHELVTPTGAAILVAHGATFGPMPALVLRAIGVGGGTRRTQRPNICRVLIGDRSPESGARLEDCVLLETNIDDQTPEGLGYAIESLVRDGALDAWVVPIVMKKSRPAFQLSVLVRPGDEARLLDAIFRRTTTIGIRRRETTRWALERDELTVRVHDLDVRVKVARLDNEVVNVAPEFEDCVKVAELTGIPLKDISAEAASTAQRVLN